VPNARKVSYYFEYVKNLVHNCNKDLADRSSLNTRMPRKELQEIGMNEFTFHAYSFD
jgi:hypothetical protein